METQAADRKVVLLDDDFIIRQVIKTVLADVRKKLGFTIHVYTSGNGIEGLGYIALSKPNVLIVDATLPKYSGRELIEFIATNPKYQTPDIRVIVLSDRKIPMKLPPNHVVLNKDDHNFVSQLTHFCIEGLLLTQQQPVHPLQLGMYTRFKMGMLGITVRMANRADLRMAGMKQKHFLWRVFSYTYWFLEQVGVSVLLGFSNILNEKLPDENIMQNRADLARFRVREYPTLASALLAIFFVIFQAVLLTAGGIVVFSVRIESVFADYSPEFSLDLSTAQFDNQKVEYRNGKISLKESVNFVSTTSPTPVTSAEQGHITVPDDRPSQGTLLGEGLSTTSTTRTDIYPYDNPQVLITQGVEYSKLLSIIEESSLNTATTSIKPINEVGMSIPRVAVTYQLSPDNQNWYYYSLINNAWEPSTLGLGHSNVIQHVNHYLPEFEAHVGVTKTLYIKVFLHSDGATQVSISAIKINRRLDVITPVEEVSVE